MAQEWWQKTVFYQIYPRSFSDSNGDGIGDIPGIISKLDYLQDLGIGAIWLSPVYRSPNHDNGYDISDYYDINPEYGTLDDMKRLFAEAKRRNIRIIMDLVINHTSDEHPWFVEAQKPDSPYRDYYIWKDAKHGRQVPNNWLSYFGGSAWQWHDKSGQYYLHLFSRHQPDLNFRNPAVIEEIKTIMRFWLDMGASGFRCDTINMIYKTSFSNGHYSLFHLPGSHHYFSQEGTHTVLRELSRDVLKPYGAFTVGEIAGGVDAATAKRFVTDELDTIFTLDHLTVDEWGMPFAPRRYRPESLKRALIKWQQALSWNALFFENHDIERSLSKFRIIGRHKTQGATMLATLLLTLRGVPFIYQGEEIGMENYPFTSIDEVQDPGARGVYAMLRRYHVPERLAFRFAMMVCRDHARTPMQWDTSRNAGFTTGTPWRPVHPNFKEVNVLVEKGDKDSVYEYYQALLLLRNATPALQDGTCTVIPSTKGIFAYRREKDGTAYVVIVNMSPRQQRYVPPAGICAMSNYSDTGARVGVLHPYEAVIIHENAGSA